MKEAVNNMKCKVQEDTRVSLTEVEDAWEIVAVVLLGFSVSAGEDSSEVVRNQVILNRLNQFDCDIIQLLKTEKSLSFFSTCDTSNIFDIYFQVKLWHLNTHIYLQVLSAN